MAALPTTGINGRPVAIAPHMTYAPEESPIGEGGLLSSILCGAAGDPPFLLCNGSADNNEVDFDANPTGVFVAVHTKQWQLACERVKVYPREASTWVVRYGAPVAAAAPEGGAAPGVGSGSSDRYDEVAVASPRPATQAEEVASTPTGAINKQKVLRWRMLPLHAAILFGAPAEVVTTLLRVYPPGCSAHDDQGMLPLHLAFRCGASEEIALILLGAYPKAIERLDYKGRPPSMLAPKNAASYGDSVAEAFVKGPSYYYWASRVATADRVRSETAMAKQVKAMEEAARKAEKQLQCEIEALTNENAELKERMVWYETKYDGAEEKEKVLVDHTNSLAERLRLTSLSEEHLATKLAKLEARLQNKEFELEQARKTAADEKGALQECVDELERNVTKTKHRAESLTERLEKKVLEGNEMKVRFEKERQLFERQIKTSKECLMELIASSKEDKRMFEEDSRELRRQLLDIQSEVQKASMDERRMMTEDSQQLRQQLASIENEVRKAASVNSSRSAESTAAAKAESQALEEKLESLRREVADNTATFVQRVDFEAEERSTQYTTTKQLEDRLNSLQKEVASARAYIGHASAGREEPAAASVEGHSDARRYPRAEPQASSERLSQQHSHSTASAEGRGEARQYPHAEQQASPERLSQQHSQSHSYSSRGSVRHSGSERGSVHSSKSMPKATAPKVVMPLRPPPDIMEDSPFDTYVSMSQASAGTDQTRDDTDCFSHQSDVSTAVALGELSDEQRLALEQLDLSGSKEQIKAMLNRVPGLTKNQVNLLVDVASSLAV